MLSARFYVYTVARVQAVSEANNVLLLRSVRVSYTLACMCAYVCICNARNIEVDCTLTACEVSRFYVW